MKRTDYVHPVKESDLPQILSLLQLVQLPIEGVPEHVGDFIQITARGKRGGPILGCVGLEIYDGSALLRSLAVEPEHQGKGYGRELTAAITEYARKRGVAVLFLLTSTAESFFAKVGFVRVERETVPAAVKRSVEFKSACPMSAVCMMKRL